MTTFAEEAERAGRDLFKKQKPAFAPANLGTSDDPPPVKKTIRFRARVAAHLGKGGKPRDAIVTIDKALTLRIRPFRGRKTYEMSMEQAVAWLMQKLVVGEIGKPRKRRRI
jgi:hypothetical protein